MKRSTIKTIATILAGIVVIESLLGGFYYILTNGNKSAVETKIEEKIVDANAKVIESEDQPDVKVDVVEAGEEKTIDVKTVDEIDGGKTTTENDGKTEEELNLGKGAWYDPTSPKSWVDATFGKCLDLDGWYGSQCVDYMGYFMYQEYGRWLSTNGTGAAYGIWDAKEQNAGDDMLLVYDKANIPVGTWAVFNGGAYGHVGLVLGYTDENHVLLAGENQGGAACAGGGAAVNIINMSLNNFRGGFLPKAWYVEPAPEPEPEPASSDKISYIYVPSDYFSGVVVRLGLATWHGLWGVDGDVAYYNQQLLAQGLVMDDNGRIYGNIPIGSELVLERRAE